MQSIRNNKPLIIMFKHFETAAIRNQTERTQFSEHSTPLYLTSSFVFNDAEEMRASFAEEKERNLYSRFTNPNTTEFVNKIVSMEGAEAGYAFATGMSAIFSTFAALLSAGDHIVSCRSVFGSTHSMFTKFLPKWNIETSYFKVDEVDLLESLIQPNTKILYIETPTNPAVDILDLELIGQIAKKHKLIYIVDNCFDICHHDGFEKLQKIFYQCDSYLFIYIFATLDSYDFGGGLDVSCFVGMVNKLFLHD